MGGAGGGFTCFAETCRKAETHKRPSSRAQRLTGPKAGVGCFEPFGLVEALSMPPPSPPPLLLVLVCAVFGLVVLLWPPFAAAAAAAAAAASFFAMPWVGWIWCWWSM